MAERTTLLYLSLFHETHRLAVNRAVDLLDCSRPAATRALRVLEAAAVLHPLDDRKKNRAVVFKAYLDHLREGTEPPSRDTYEALGSSRPDHVLDGFFERVCATPPRR